MSIVILVRHGENDYVKKGRLAGRKPGVHLNEKGRAQAENVAKVLAKVKIKAVYTSPLDRTMETAQPIAEAHGLEVIPREGLLEVDYGKWQDKSLKQVARQNLWRLVQHHPSQARFPEGESFADAQHRIIGEIETLCGMHKPKDVFVCISHSDMIKLAAAYYLGTPLDLFQRIIVQPGSITTLHLDRGGIRVINLNHIPPQAGEQIE
jgi:probable phosphomutase (TIGR03848 family)